MYISYNILYILTLNREDIHEFPWKLRIRWIYYMQLWWKKIVLGLGKVIPFKKSAPHYEECSAWLISLQVILKLPCSGRVWPFSCEAGSCPWAVRPPPLPSFAVSNAHGATHFPTVCSTVRVRLSGLLVKFTVYVYTVEKEGQKHLPSSYCFHTLHGNGRVLLPTDTHFFPLYHWDMVRHGVLWCLRI